MVLAVVGITVALALAAALFVLPVRTWFDQDNEIDRRQAQLDELEAINAELQGDVDRLQTDDGVREAARDELGYVENGEQRSTMLDYPNLPNKLPNGWPYSIVTDIVDVRTGS